jgi:CRP/FNR family transcriptional regulator
LGRGVPAGRPETTMLDDDQAAALTGVDLRCGHEFQTTCDTCRLRVLCLPAGLPSAELQALEALIDQRRAVEKNTHLYLQNQPFRSLFAIISGAVKTYTTHSDGWTRVSGCYLPGEIFGFSGIEKDHYLSYAKALKKTWVCEIPFADLEQLSRAVPGLQSQLFRLMSRRIIEDHALIAQFFDKRPARKRIAAFLLSLSTRAARRGESPTDIRLPMSRTDIGSYLAVSPETISRELGRLERLDIIAVKGRQLSILDLHQLRQPVCALSG